MTRLLILSVLILIIDLFAFQAFRYLVMGSAKSVRMATYVVYWAIPVMTVLFVIGFATGWSENLPKGFIVTFRTLIFIVYFAKLMIAAVILIDDFRRLIFGALNIGFSEWKLSTQRSKWMTYTAIALGSIPLFSLIYGMARNPYRYQVLKTKVPVKDLHPDLEGIKIVQISDIHSGSFLMKEPVERSIDLINELKPDIVFFTGDLVNSKADEMEPFIEMFSKIDAPLGVFSVLGNHDYGDYHQWPTPADKVKNFETLLSTHKALGWDLLMNEHRKVVVKESVINVIGVENFSANARFPKYGDLAKASEGISGNGVNILLSHDPSHWDYQVLKDFKQINLTLSGHTHGFQFGVEIPGFVKWSPIQYMYPRWAGLYQIDQQYLYVNRGLGFLGYPGRVGILPEITMLTLTAA